MPIAPPRPVAPSPTRFLVESYLDIDKSKFHWRIPGMREEWWLPMERLTYFRTQQEGLVPLATLYDLQRLGAWMEENGGGVPELPLGQIFVGNVDNLAIATPKNQVPLSDWGKANNTVWLGTGGTSLNYLSNVRDPALPQDAATKFYVDSVAAGAEGISLNPLSFWGRSLPTPAGPGPGESIGPRSVGPALYVPVARNHTTAGATQDFLLQRSIFYGRITVSNTTHKTFSFTHNLNTRSLVVVVREVATQKVVFPGVEFPTDNQLRITFKYPPGDTIPTGGTPLPTLPIVFIVLAIGVEQMRNDVDGTKEYFVDAVGS